MSQRRSRPALPLASLLALLFVGSFAAAGCGDSSDSTTPTTAGPGGSSGTGGTAGSSGTAGTSGTAGSAGSGATGGTGGTGGTAGTSGTAGTGGTAGAGGTGGSANAICEQLGLPSIAFSAGPYGTHRLDIAEDVSVPLLDGSTWTLSQNWSGCESYLFIPDSIAVSELDATSIWEKDLDQLVKKSPKNVHYFFVSRAGSDDKASTNLTAMQARIDALLPTLSAEDAAHWQPRLHVVGQRAASLTSWVGTTMKGAGIGALGIAIDRAQRIRGVGYLSDVARYDQALSDAMMWPWELNLAMARREAELYNAEALRQAKLDAENATVVEIFKGETLAEFAEADVILPSAAELANFDTLEVDVQIQCPDPDSIEFNNCGAWDYIASLGVQDASMNNIEIARFITSYHRETHWVVDASAMLALLKDGGTRHFRWDFAPSWNTQPSATKLSLRFSNQNKGYRPSAATFLYSGGTFTTTYNDLYMPIDVPISANAKRVELWAIITGHGGEQNNCAEFCNHKHNFKVNGNTHLKQHTEAGTQSKCEARTPTDALVPNQAGTWWFGRGGWCPGMQVDPWVVDVTAEVTPGQNATIEYQGLYGNAAPTAASGNIDMVSYLVVYE